MIAKKFVAVISSFLRGPILDLAGKMYMITVRLLRPTVIGLKTISLFLYSPFIRLIVFTTDDG